MTDLAGVAGSAGVADLTVAGGALAGLDAAALCELPVSQRVRLLEVLTDSVVGVEQDDAAAPVGLDVVAISVRTHRVVERLTGVRMRWLDQAEGDGLWAADRSFRSFASYVASSHGLPRAEAAAQVRLARTLRAALPVAAAALRAGTLTLAKARTLANVAASSDARIAALAELAEIDDTGSDHAQPDDGHIADSTSGETSPGGTADDAGAPGAGVTVEGVLVRYGTQLRPEDFTTIVRQFSALADPDACERGFREASEREYLSLARTTGGFHLAGFLTESSGQFLRARLEALMGNVTPADGRSHQQRMAHALTALARADVGTGDPARAQIGITMTLADLERLGLPLPGAPVADEAEGTDQAADRTASQEAGRAAARTAGQETDGAADRTVGGEAGEDTDGTADRAGARSLRALASPPRWSDGTGPVPDPVLRELLDSADIYRVVFGPDSTVLDLGRSSRFFSRRLRNAIITRDGGCVYPDCHLPAPYCEVHHVLAWLFGGRTCLENGALLCGHHNRLVDDKKITMTRTDPAGIHPDQVRASGPSGTSTGSPSPHLWLPDSD